MVQQKKKNETAKTTEPVVEDNGKLLPFKKMNYILVIVGICLVALGMILMIGGGSNDPDVFNEKMFNFQRITLAPILVLAGFVVEMVAIFWRKKQ